MVQIVCEYFGVKIDLSIGMFTVQRVCEYFGVKIDECFHGADKVCEYFGVKIALYFAYLGHYTTFLLWPALLGLFFWVFEGSHQVRACRLVFVAPSLFVYRRHRY